MSPDRWDVIVVGAGLAGLKAALTLQHAGKRVLLLEARDRVGGRALRGEICGRPVDFGGQWVGARHHLLRSQAEELGIEMVPQYTDGASLTDFNGHVRSSTSGLPKLSLISLLDFGLIGHRWGRGVAGMPEDAPWSAPRAAEWDALSLEDWISRNGYTGAGRALARLVTGAILCADADQVSFLFFLECLRQGGGLDVMTGVRGGAQQDKFRGGAWQIAHLMGERLGDRLILDSPVEAVAQDAAGVRVTSHRNTYTADRVIITVPPELASRIQYEPALPERRAGLMQRMRMGSVIKLHAAYSTPFWRRRDLDGSVLSVDRTVSIVFDQTPEDGSIGILVGLIEGSHALEMSALDQSTRRERVVADLTHYFGEEAAEPLEYVDYDWVADKWALGGYAAHMPPGVMTTCGEAIRQPCGRIHWAGTETANRFIGYFEGALESGLRAAGEVLSQSE